MLLPWLSYPHFCIGSHVFSVCTGQLLHAFIGGEAERHEGTAATGAAGAVTGGRPICVSRPTLWVISPSPPWFTTQTCCHKSRQGWKKWCFTSCCHTSDPFLSPAAGGVANAHAPCGFFGSRALAGTFLPRSERADQGGVAKWWNGLSPSAVQKNIHHYESHNDIMLYTYPYNHIYISLYPPSSVPSWSSPAYIRIDRGWGDSTIWAQQNRWTQEGWRQWLSGWKMMMSWSLGPAGRMMMCSGLHTWIWKYGGFKGSVWQERGCLMDSLPAKSLLNDARKRTGNTKYFPSTTFKHILVGGLEHEFYLPFHIWVI